MPFGPSSYSSVIVVASFPRWNPTAAGSPHPLSLTVFLRGISATDVHNDCGEPCHSESRVHLEFQGTEAAANGGAGISG